MAFYGGTAFSRATFDEIRSGADLKIIGVDGTTIVHSHLLADRKRLMSEIRRYCADELPPDFPQEPA
jgi:hypothetical protein